MTTQLLSPPLATTATSMLTRLAAIHEAGERALRAELASSTAVRDLPWRRWRIAESMGADFQRALAALEGVCRETDVFGAAGGAACRETIVALRRGRMDLMAFAVEPGAAGEREFEVVLERVGRLWGRGVGLVRESLAGPGR